MGKIWRRQCVTGGGGTRRSRRKICERYDAANVSLVGGGLAGLEERYVKDMTPPMCHWWGGDSQVSKKDMGKI